MFLKLKQESTAYSSWAHSEADKDKYIEDYRRSEGIALVTLPISKNAGQHTFAKLKLNSMSGKWAQNQNKTQTSLVTSDKEFYGLLTSPGTEVTSLIIPNDGVTWVNWIYSEQKVSTGKNIKVAFAAFVTTQALLKLYEYLRELGRVCVVLRYRLGNLHSKSK
jgi:hypothetical protein